MLKEEEREEGPCRGLIRSSSAHLSQSVPVQAILREMCLSPESSVFVCVYAHPELCTTALVTCGTVRMIRRWTSSEPY
ncbi:hypothetical protein ATANTOWER_001954 [Ataeniobius toweri]|uniref:Uncharacterized protein n=1 Tax=Ataeniobius toweri TaxID=208326 RepID=A0ABU7ALL4_9TELE|nr:hypothetical protein [Ataeniobius toweri]